MSLWIASVGVKEGVDKNLGLQVLAVVLALASGLYVHRRSSHDTHPPPLPLPCLYLNLQHHAHGRSPRLFIAALLLNQRRVGVARCRLRFATLSP